jgi:hypothetical protein
MNIIDLIIFYEEANHACQTKIMTFLFVDSVRIYQFWYDSKECEQMRIKDIYNNLLDSGTQECCIVS